MPRRPSPAPAIALAALIGAFVCVQFCDGQGDAPKPTTQRPTTLPASARAVRAASPQATQPATKPAARAARTQPAGSTLEFRIAPGNSSGRGGPTLDAGELKSYLDWLEQGKVGLWWKESNVPGIAGRMPKYLWLPVRGDANQYEHLITGQYAGKSYLLVSDEPNQSMVPSRDANKAWGLKRVYPTKDDPGRPSLGVEFDPKGAELFAALTGGNLHNAMAIIVDGEVLSAPTIQSKISSKAVITGQFSQDDVDKMVKFLRLGMLPAAPSTGSGQAEAATAPAAKVPAAKPTPAPAATSPVALPATRESGEKIIRPFQLKDANANEAAFALRQQYPASIFVVDDRSNKLIVSATPDEMEKIARAVERLDPSAATPATGPGHAQPASASATQAAAGQSSPHATRETKAEDSNWSETLNGIRIRLIAPEGTAYRAKSPLPVLVEIQNNGDKAVAYGSLWQTVRFRAEDSDGNWLGIPAMGPEVGEWAGKSGSLDPGKSTQLKMYFEALRFQRPLKAGETIRLQVGAPTQQLRAGKLPLEVLSPPLVFQIRDAFPPALQEADIAKTWQLDFACETNMGLMGSQTLHVDAQGDATLVQSYQRDGKPVKGRLTVALPPKRLDELAAAFRKMEAWKLADVQWEIANPDESLIRLAVVSPSGGSLVGTFASHLERKQPIVAEMRQLLESLIADVEAQAAASAENP